MAQVKVEDLMQRYAALSATERQQFEDMLTGYRLSKQPQKKAAATKKSAASKAAEA